MSEDQEIVDASRKILTRGVTDKIAELLHAHSPDPVASAERLLARLEAAFNTDKPAESVEAEK